MYLYVLQEKSLTASANIANFADELTAAELAEITQKTLSATSKFTANVKGEKVRICFCNHRKLIYKLFYLTFFTAKAFVNRKNIPCLTL